jgi:DNA-binding CsgD family transcriptional regulator
VLSDEGPNVLVLSFKPRRSSVEAGRLTVAESEVLLRLLDGCTNDEIATQRGVSMRTVANQVASIFRKLGVSSRSELAATAALLR